jgi:hypothetical protein
VLGSADCRSTFIPNATRRRCCRVGQPNATSESRRPRTRRSPGSTASSMCRVPRLRDANRLASQHRPGGADRVGLVGLAVAAPATTRTGCVHRRRSPPPRSVPDRRLLRASTAPPAQPLRRPPRQLGARRHHQPTSLAQTDPAHMTRRLAEGRTHKMIVAAPNGTSSARSTAPSSRTSDSNTTPTDHHESPLDIQRSFGHWRMRWSVNPDEHGGGRPDGHRRGTVREIRRRRRG